MRVLRASGKISVIIGFLWFLAGSWEYVTDGDPAAIYYLYVPFILGGVILWAIGDVFAHVKIKPTHFLRWLIK